MEQVAEALKQLQTNGLWKPEINGIAYRICDEVEEILESEIYNDQVIAVLQAIVEIYSKKSPVIEWHTHSGSLDFTQFLDLVWHHDITGELYDYMYLVEKKYPEHASKWADGKFGGKCFSIGDEQFITSESVRGIGYPAVIAFDKHGNGAVFFKDKL